MKLCKLALKQYSTAPLNPFKHFVQCCFLHYKEYETPRKVIAISSDSNERYN